MRRADFHYVNTGTVEELDAWVAGVMAESRECDAGEAPAARPRGWSARASAASALSSSDTSRAGAAHPLSAPLRADRPRSRAQLRPRPGAPRRRDLHREQVRRERPLGRRRDRPDAAAAGHGAGDRGPHRRARVRRRRPLRPRRSTSATAPGTCGTCSTATATSARRSPPTTPARATSTAGGPRGLGIQFPETRDYVDKVERLKTIYARAYGSDARACEGLVPCRAECIPEQAGDRLVRAAGRSRAPLDTIPSRISPITGRSPRLRGRPQLPARWAGSIRADHRCSASGRSSRAQRSRKVGVGSQPACPNSR